MPSGLILRLEPTFRPAHPDGRRIVVLDTTWTPSAADREGDAPPIALREVAERVLTSRDLIAETTRLLDAWAEGSGVVEAMTADGTSFWHYFRLRHWMWLQQLILWLAIADELVNEAQPAGIECAPGTDEGLVEAARLVAAHRGLTFRSEEPALVAGPVLEAAPAKSLSTARRLVRSVFSRIRPDEAGRRRRFVAQRIDHLERERCRCLLVVLEHARQQVETPDGPRLINAYLGPIVDRLRGTRLEPIELDIRARLTDDESWQRLSDPDSARLLPADAIWTGAAPAQRDDTLAWVEQAAATIEASTGPALVSGIDLGPAIAAQVAAEARRGLASPVRNVGRIRKLLERLRPSGILLADEYHRQEWLAAAKGERVPTAAVQHGLIWHGHAGYIHPDRPDALRLPNRTYVFGAWEAELLRTRSVFRPDELEIGGSPRLDLVRTEPVDRDAVRTQLGVAAGDRMVVVSGTWNALYRRFHYPISLAALVDRPLPGVHLVVKLHPGEPDEGPYRAVIEGAAGARGFEPPPITIVKSIDLYQLLSAADAHVGIYSTVLTEAVWTGTPNLLLDFLPAADLLGYVPAGVASPIRSGKDLLAALDDPTPAAADARRQFLDAHFEPGNASERIAADLLAWLP